MPNREEIHRAFQHTDQAINKLRAEHKALAESCDKMYLNALTTQMMWDVLMGLLSQKSIITKEQFDQALLELRDETQKAMDAAAAKKPEARIDAKVTIVSETPGIPVVK